MVTTAVTELAEFALDTACREACAELDEAHGAPLGPDEPIRTAFIGVGGRGPGTYSDLVKSFQSVGTGVTKLASPPARGEK